MMRRTRVWLAALTLLTALTTGCGRGGDRQKNLDHDRPKATAPAR